MDAWVFQNIFQSLPPKSLLVLGCVSKDFYNMSRSDNAWKRHKDRILEYCPNLTFVFDQHKQLTDGKRVKRRRKNLVPQGTWYIFAKYLMRCPFQMALERKSGNIASVITNAVLEATILVIFKDSPNVNIRRPRRLRDGNICLNNKSEDFFFHMIMDTFIEDYCIYFILTDYDYITYSRYININGKYITIINMFAPFRSVVHDDSPDKFIEYRRKLCLQMRRHDFIKF